MFSYARGFAPCIPGTEPEAALGQGGEPRARRGVCLLPRPPTLPLAFFSPPSPRPPSQREGENITLFRRGLRPRHPCIKPFAALIVPDKQVPSAAGSLRFSAKPIEHAFLWAVPAAKERGDRGRGTSAFEMVLSPGAGRTSAAGVQLSPLPPTGTTAAGIASAAGVQPPESLLGWDSKCRKRFNARGAGGGAPGKINLESPPSPEGKGVGGMGAEKQAKGKVGRRLSPCAPPPIPQRQG